MHLYVFQVVNTLNPSPITVHTWPPLWPQISWQHHVALRWCHNGPNNNNDSNHQPQGCLLNCLFRRSSRKTSKVRVTGLCVGNSLGTGEFPTQMASNVENFSIWWCHHGKDYTGQLWHSLDWCCTCIDREIGWGLQLNSSYVITPGWLCKGFTYISLMLFKWILWLITVITWLYI